MAGQGDRYVALYEQPMQNATSYWQPVVAYIISLGTVQHSVIVTGWGQEDGHRKTMLRVELVVPKNTFTDAQFVAIAQQIQTILGTTLHSIDHNSVDVLFP